MRGFLPLLAVMIAGRRAAAARAGLRRLRGDRRHRVRHPVPGRARLAPPDRPGCAAAGRAMVMILRWRPIACSASPVSSTRGQTRYGKGYQLSHSLIALRTRRMVRSRSRRERRKAALPARGAHRLPARGAWPRSWASSASALVIGLFAWLLIRAYAIGGQAARLERPFAALVAHGIGIWLGVQAFINIGVNMGVLPTKGPDACRCSSVRRQRHRRQLRRAGDPAARRLRESTACSADSPV